MQLWELKDLTQRYADWLEAHRRPYRPRRPTDLIRDIGDICSYLDDLMDPVPIRDTYDLSDGFIDDSDQEEFRDDEDYHLAGDLAPAMEEYDEEEHDEENMDEYEADFIDDSAVDPTQGADDDDYVPPGTVANAGSDIQAIDDDSEGNTDVSGEDDADVEVDGNEEEEDEGKEEEEDESEEEADESEEDDNKDEEDEDVTLVEPSDDVGEGSSRTVTQVPTQSPGRSRKRTRLAKINASQAITALYTQTAPDDLDTADPDDESELYAPESSSSSPVVPKPRTRSSKKASKRPVTRSPVSGDGNAPAPRKRRKSFKRIESEDEDEDEGYASEGDDRDVLHKPRIARSQQRRVIDSDDEVCIVCFRPVFIIHSCCGQDGNDTLVAEGTQAQPHNPPDVENAAIEVSLYSSILCIKDLTEA